MSVNLSPRQLGGDGLVGHAKRCVAAAGLPKGQFGLEITETVLLEDNAAHLREIEELRASGIRILLDDFGTGFSSLGQLRHFPIDVLKVDRSFVDGVEHDAKVAAIAANLVALAHSLGLVAIAEGVESTEQLEVFRELGCDQAQGYLFGRPAPPEAINDLLTARATPGSR